MSSSTLDPDNLVQGDGTVTGKGHGTRALGPSDLSDSGSDVVGGPGIQRGEVLPLDRGTYEDPEGRLASDDAGGSIGDVDLDSDTDSAGTGEHSEAGRDSRAGLGHDIGFDRIVGGDEAGLGQGLDQAEEAWLGITDEELADAVGGDDDPTEDEPAGDPDAGRSAKPKDA